MRCKIGIRWAGQLLAKHQQVYTHQSCRNYRVDLVTKRLTYSEYGIPSDVVSLVEENLTCQLEPKQVLVKFLVSPVNPADINVLQGTYPMRNPLPATGGGEGVAEVVATGEDSDLSVGDWIVPDKPSSGSWISHLVTHEDYWIKVRNDIPEVTAGTLQINPCTAYRMLKDFVNLSPGDWVIQNGANSGVGQSVIQIAKSMGVKTVNIVRDRKEIDLLKEKLTVLGGDLVLTEEELRSSQLWRSGQLAKPVLGFNCVGGPSSTELCKVLANSGVLVTYGGMSRKPMIAATSHMIFKDLQLRGFWLGQWCMRQGKSEARLEMYEKVTELASKGELLPPDHQFVQLEDYREALDKTLAGFLPAKYVFKIN